jgi:hypothetical protein
MDCFASLAMTVEPNPAPPPLNPCAETMERRMKALLSFLLLAMTPAANAAEVGPCNTPATRIEMAATLRLAAEEHPVHVTFLTKAEGVKLPAHLLSKYPDEMTIILQYEFARLNVKDDRFEVVLWFKGRSDLVVVPFNAVRAFYDRDEPTCRAD